MTENQPSLASKQCASCRVDAPKATQAQIENWLPEISQWLLLENAEIPRLSREFIFPDFLQAMAFANRVGELAESEGHHPLITVEWGSALVQWWTHAINGLHENDFVMAAKTDALFTR